MFEDFPMPGRALSIPVNISRSPIPTLLTVEGYDTSVHSIVCCPETKSERKTDCRFTSPELYIENYGDYETYPDDYYADNYADPLPTPPRVR